MHVGPPISQDLTTDTSQSPRSNSSGHNNASAEKSMTVRIPQSPRRVCGKLPLCDHPDRDPHVRASGLRYYKEPNVLEGFAESSPCGSIRPWNCPVTLSNTALISHHTMTMTTEPRQSPRSNSSRHNNASAETSMTVTIPQIPRRVCGELPLWDHLALVLSGHISNLGANDRKCLPCGSIRAQIL